MKCPSSFRALVQQYNPMVQALNVKLWIIDRASFQRLYFLVTCLALSGCASVMDGGSQAINIYSSPPGADVKIETQSGQAVLNTKTPARVMLSRKNSYLVNLSMKDYKPAKRSIQQKNNPGAQSSMCIGYGAGYLVDLTTGAAWMLDPSTLDVPLERETPLGPNQLITLPPMPNSQKPAQVAVASLSSTSIAEAEKQLLTEVLRDVLVGSKYFLVVSREDMGDLLKEQNFQREMCDTTECLVEMGQLLAVEKIIGGSVGKVGNAYSVVLRIVSVETGKIECSASRDTQGGADALLELVRITGRALAREYYDATLNAK